MPVAVGSTVVPAGEMEEAVGDVGVVDHVCTYLVALGDGAGGAGGGRPSIMRRYTGHTGTTAVELPGGYFAAGGVDGTVRMWSLMAAAGNAVLGGFVAAIEALAVVDAATLVVLDSTSMSLWDLHGRDRVGAALAETAGATVTTAAVLRGRIVALGCASGAVEVWDVARRERVAALVGHTRSVRGLAVLHDGLLGSVASDGRLLAWDAAASCFTCMVAPPSASPSSCCVLASVRWR